MPAASLPENGELEIGSLRLPEGCRTHVHGFLNGSTPPIAWVTIKPVPDPGAVWVTLSQAQPHTGLVPFLARHMLSDKTRPWYDGTRRPRDFFQYPTDLTGLDQIDLAAFLRAGWHGRELSPEEELEPGWREWAEARIAPFSREFPGLAPACDQPLDQAEMRGAIGCLPPARIGLAIADRPTDALAAMGWMPGNWFDGVPRLTAVLRSWEDRFGARLLAVGESEFKLLAERPPRGMHAAQHVAAEVFALGPDEFTCAWEEWALTEVNEIADSMIRSPIWGFWWD
jgi:hypothetical protein